MKTDFTYLWLLALVLLILPACVREEWNPVPEESRLARVPVSLELTVAPVQDGTPGTKTLQDPDLDGVTAASQIANILLLQFDGTTTDAHLVGEQLYFDHWPLLTGEQLSLVPSDSPSTVVVLANTFDRVPITPGTTLGNFMENCYTSITGLSGVVTTKGGNDYFRLSGSKYLESITAGTTESISLKRNVAKVVITVSNSSSGPNAVTLNEVQLMGINAKYYYLAHIDPELSSLVLSDPYAPNKPCRFNVARQAFSGTSQTYTYYVPLNLRGTNANDNEWNKGNLDPGGSTFFRVFGTYGSGNTPITYTYCLGGNLTNDYNLRPNYSYSYTFDIASKGDARYDFRIDDMAEVTYTKDANCYMLQPPEAEGQSRIYAFPVRRAATFWNADDGTNEGYGASGQSGFTAYECSESTSWAVEVIWSDFDMTPYLVSDPAADGYDDRFLQVSTGTGFYSAQSFIKVKVHAGMKGNVLVGLKKRDPATGAILNTLLWSWHLWITDYNPDRDITPAANTYLYSVRGGEVHRYNNDLWNTGAYANAFAMDRNVGALGVSYNISGSRGLYYQFGRKDPFIDRHQLDTANRYYLGGTRSVLAVTGYADSEDLRSILNAHTGAGSLNTCYAVSHPTVFIYGNNDNWNWTVNGDPLADGGTTSFLWNDRNYLHSGDTDILEKNKSIYDPCPPGWKVPIDGTWAGMVYSNDSAVRTAAWSSSNLGIYYYPETYENSATTGAIFFPASGLETVGGGGVSSVGSTGSCWSATPLSASHGLDLSFSSERVTPSHITTQRGFGCSVRCVREEYRSVREE